MIYTAKQGNYPINRLIKFFNLDILHVRNDEHGIDVARSILILLHRREISHEPVFFCILVIHYTFSLRCLYGVAFIWMFIWPFKVCYKRKLNFQSLLTHFFHTSSKLFLVLVCSITYSIYIFSVSVTNTQRFAG